MNNRDVLFGAYFGAIGALAAWYAFSRLGNLDARVRKLEWDKGEPERKESLSNAQTRWREEAYKQHADMHRQMEPVK